MDINKRIDGMTYAIREIVVNAREVEKEGHDVLKLNIGDPNKYDFDTPDYHEWRTTIQYLHHHTHPIFYL